MKLINATKGDVISADLEIAERFFQKMKGLLGRKGFADGSALLIRSCSSIHMFFMRFAIDAVFVDKRMTVMKVCPDLKPWRLAGSFGADAVVELPEGAARRHNIEKGDQLRMEE